MKYIVSSTAWPKGIWKREPNVEEDILLSFDSGGGFSLLKVGGGVSSWKLVSFADSWPNLKHLKGLFEEDRGYLSTEEMVSALRELGFRPDFDYHGQLGLDSLTAEELGEAAREGNEKALTLLIRIAVAAEKRPS